MEKQRKFDFTARGGQLQLLERARLPFPGTRMGVLRAIDDAIGRDREWVISIDRLIVATGWSRSTVSRSVADLCRLQIVDVTDRIQRFPGGGVQRLPGLFRIVWSNLSDFVPECSGLADSPAAGPVIEGRRRCESSPAYQVGGSGHSDPGVGSLRPGGRVSLTRLSGQTDSDPVRPVPPVPSPSRKTLEGKDGRTDADAAGQAVWRSVCDSPDLLRRAVKRSDGRLIGGLWSAAVALGWVPDNRDIRRRFLAAAFYVTNPPAGFPVENPGRLLRWKTEQRNWTTGNGDGSDDDWAAAMSRRLDGTDQLPRASPREPELDVRAEAARQHRQLLERVGNQ